MFCDAIKHLKWTMNTTTNADRVRKANAALIARGGRRMPSGYLQPGVNAALEGLISSGYAGSPVAAISQALIDAHKKMALVRKSHTTPFGDTDTSQEPHTADSRCG